MIRYLLGLALITTPAAAKEFTVTDQDQADIVTVCEAAARSPAIGIEVNAQIANWCVRWKGRMQAANMPQPPAPPPATPE